MSSIWALLLGITAGTQDTLIAGVLRADGIVIPYAAYAAGEWRRIDDDDAVPRSIVNRTKAWHYVGSDGTTHQLEPGSVVRFTDSDDWYEHWGQVTDFCPRSPPEGYPVGRLGVVLDEDRGIRPMASLEDAPAPVVALIEERFGELETAQVRSLVRDSLLDLLPVGTPIEEEERRGAIEVEAMFAADLDTLGGRLIYFEAVRRYPSVPHPDPRYVPYTPFTRLNGWMVERGEDTVLVGHDLFLTCCAGMEVFDYLPFAILPLGERTFVLAELQGWEGVSRTVFELRDSELVTVLEDS